VAFQSMAAAHGTMIVRKDDVPFLRHGLMPQEGGLPHALYHLRVRAAVGAGEPGYFLHIKIRRLDDAGVGGTPSRDLTVRNSTGERW
jgi:hypothetical protein